MQNIERLVGKAIKKSISQADLRAWFFNDQPGIRKRHLERFAGFINDFMVEYKKCKDPQCYIVATRCGHLRNQTYSPQNRRLYLNALFIRTNLPGVAEGLDRRNTNLGIADMEEEACKFAVSHPRVVKHSTNKDVIGLVPVSLERALKQYVINAQDEYFREIARDTPDDKLDDFIERNLHRIYCHRYIIKDDYAILAKYGMMPKERLRYIGKRRPTPSTVKYKQQRSEQPLKSQLNIKKRGLRKYHAMNAIIEEDVVI